MTFTIRTVLFQRAPTLPAKPPLTDTYDVIEPARAIFATLDPTVEHFCVFALDAQCRIIGYKVIATGNRCNVSFAPSEVFRAALVLGATSVIVLHNHPNGDPTPSAPDIVATESLEDLGRRLGLPVVDHLILGGLSFRSVFEDHAYNTYVSDLRKVRYPT
jgi:DNA repair protein RadC